MTNYEKAIRTVTEVKTLKSHMESLGKVMALSEDGQLTQLISQVIWGLQYQFQNSTSKSMPTSLLFHPIPPTIQMVEYCKQQMRFKKPEWQVLAERNGWLPPPR